MNYFFFDENENANKSIFIDYYYDNNGKYLFHKTTEFPYGTGTTISYYILSEHGDFFENTTKEYIEQLTVSTNTNELLKDQVLKIMRELPEYDLFAHQPTLEKIKTHILETAYVHSWNTDIMIIKNNSLNPKRLKRVMNRLNDLNVIDITGYSTSLEDVYFQLNQWLVEQGFLKKNISYNHYRPDAHGEEELVLHLSWFENKI